MAFSSGVYTLPGAALSTGDTVSATDHNQVRNDMATAFNLTWLRNGTATATANIPMGGYKLTGLGVATTSGDALSYGQAATVSDLTSSGTVTFSGGTANGVAYLNGSKVVTTGSALVFDGSNLGVGVTPSAWHSSARAIQLGTVADSGVLYSSVGFNHSNVGIGANFYQNSSFNAIYMGSYAATKYQQDNGVHAWYNAPSGTAGNTISFTQAMTLDASGNWILGATATSPSNNNAIWLSPSSSTARFTNTGAAGKEWSIGTSSPGVAGVGDYFSFSRYSGSAWAEFGRFDSSGNLLVGLTSAANYGKLQIAYTGGSDPGNGILMRPSNNNGTAIQFKNAAGSGIGYIYTSASATEYNTGSDYRLKDITGPLVGALERNARLQPKVGSWKADGAYFEGFLAHELQAEIPHAARGEKDAVDENGDPIYQTVGTGPLDAHFTACINELNAIITQLQADVVDLTTQIAALKA